MTAVNKGNKSNNYLTLKVLKCDQQFRIPILHIYSKWHTELSEQQ